MIDKVLKDFLARQWKHYFPYAVMIAVLAVAAVGGLSCGLGALVAALNGSFLTALFLLIVTGALAGVSFLLWCLLDETNDYYEELAEAERRELRKRMYTESAAIKESRNDFEMRF